MFVLVPLFVLAEDREAKTPDFSKQTVVTGTFVCIGCELGKEGADAQCTLHGGHTLGFRDGDGALWTFVDNKRGHPLAANAKLRDREARLKGWAYPKHRYFEAWQYELKDGDAWVMHSWCDNCRWEKGDHGEKDLCEDCEE